MELRVCGRELINLAALCVLLRSVLCSLSRLVIKSLNPVNKYHMERCQMQWLGFRSGISVLMTGLLSGRSGPTAALALIFLTGARTMISSLYRIINR